MRYGKSYVPCIRWKQGEYLALQRLSTATRNYILPLLEVAEIGFDFETQTESKSIDDHLRPFAKRVREKWGIDECLVDLRHLDEDARMATGEHPVIYIFNDLRVKGVNSIPVIGLEEGAEYRLAIRQILDIDHRGFCVRVNLEDAASSNLFDQMKDLLMDVKETPSNCDLILDLGAPPNFEPIDAFANLVSSVVRSLPHLNTWRSFGIIGTSFPSSLSGIQSGKSFLPRNEWILYKELVGILQKQGERIPTFGDYVINHPDVMNIDMRFMKPKANVRYTLGDNWLIARGQHIRDYGEHKALCELVVADRGFYGNSFSVADKYIYDCSNGNASTGNLTTWRWVGTNHHLEVVARDAASLASS